MAGGSTAPSFYCGVVNYTTGTVVFSTTWTPVTSDPSPNLATNGPSGYRVNAIGYTTRPKGVYRGTLLIEATLDAVSLPNPLQIMMAGNAEWDVATKTTPSVMTERNHSVDLSLAGI